MKPISKALLLFCIVILAVACSKDKEINPDNDSSLTLANGSTFDISGVWDLNARLPISDSVWHMVPNDDGATYIFTKDGKYSMGRSTLEASGTYTLRYVTEQGITAVKLTLYTPGDATTEWRLGIQDDKTFRMDWWLAWCGTGYSSLRYKKAN